MRNGNGQRVGLIGCGSLGTRHARGIVQIEGAELGAVGSLGCTRVNPTGHFTFTVVGTEGSITTNDYGGKGILSVTYADRQTRELAMPDTDEYKEEVAYFLRCLRDGEKPEPGVREGRRIVEIGTLAYEAFEQGKRVAV